MLLSIVFMSLFSASLKITAAAKSLAVEQSEKISRQGATIKGLRAQLAVANEALAKEIAVTPNLSQLIAYLKTPKLGQPGLGDDAEKLVNTLVKLGYTLKKLETGEMVISG